MEENKKGKDVVGKNMELEITQNGWGRYRIFASENNSAFTLWIQFDGNKKSELIKEDGKDVNLLTFCKLRYDGEENRIEELDGLFNSGKIEEIFEICKENSGGVWYSSVGGVGTRESILENHKFFVEIFNKNREMLSLQWKSKRLKELEKELERVKEVKFEELTI